MTDHEVVISDPDSSGDALDELAPLWRQMQLHQIAVAQHEHLNHDLERGWAIRRERYVRELGRGGAILRAHRGGRLVGYCALSLQPRPSETFSSMAAVMVITLTVDEAERGRGVGSALLRAAEDAAHGLGADTLGLEVMPGNDRARGLYERLGFEPVEVRMHRRIIRSD